MKHDDLKDVDLNDLEIIFYASPKRPAMPLSKVARAVLPLKVICNKMVITQRSQERDFIFLKASHLSPDVPDYNGFNTRHARESGESIKPGTTLMYTPLIDRTPSDPSTMLTAMIESQRLTNEAGQQIAIFTADQ